MGRCVILQANTSGLIHLRQTELDGYEIERYGNERKKMMTGVCSAFESFLCRLGRTGSKGLYMVSSTPL